MNTSSISALISQFAGQVTLSGESDGYPILHINNALAQASIALHGAQVLHFQPKGEQDVLWTSQSAIYQEGKAIRGGIPICWPWFGPCLHAPQLQAHGFARNHFWTLDSIVEQADHSTRITLHLLESEATRALWQHAFELSVSIVIGSALSVALNMANSDSKPVQITAALHSYLHISEIEKIHIRGLENTSYIDKLAGDAIFASPDPITFTEETDRIYLATQSEVQIDDPGLGRILTIAKSGSNTTVVWNPWIEKSSKMNDFDRDGYKRMVCIEATNAADDVIALAPGESHCLSTTISLNKIR